MKSPEESFLLWDARYMTDPDRANCLCVEDSLQKAKQAVEELFGYQVVITGPGYESGLYWVPKAMRGHPDLRDMHGKIVDPLPECGGEGDR